MRITEFPQFLPSRYDRINQLRRELARYATYAQVHGDSYLTDWLTNAVAAMTAQMPNGTDTNVET